MLRHAPPSVVHGRSPKPRIPLPSPAGRGSREGRWRSTGDHTHQDAIPAHELMIKCGTDMQGRKTRDGGSD
jgi:hypothetical protein